MTDPAYNSTALAPPPIEVIPKGQIYFEDLFLHSHLATYIAKSCACASIAAIPFAAGTFGAVLPPLAGTAFIVAAIALPLILAAVNYKSLLYDISLIYTVLTKKAWWGKIDENVILGAIPLDQHLKTLTDKEKVTHVLTLVDYFELEAGIVCPITTQQWSDEKVNQLHIPTPDFLGVTPENIQQGVEFVEKAREEKGIVYIHCKAGRGRSATIVVADKIKQNLDKKKFTIKQILQAAIAEVKEICPDINLNPKQKASLIEYIQYELPMILVRDKIKQNLNKKNFSGSITQFTINQILQAAIAEVKEICPDINLNPKQQASLREYIKKNISQKTQ